MQLQIGRAIPNFYRAEHDPLSNDVLVADGYRIEDGKAVVPEVPGCGLSLNEDAFRRDVKIVFDIKA